MTSRKWRLAATVLALFLAADLVRADIGEDQDVRAGISLAREWLQTQLD